MKFTKLFQSVLLLLTMSFSSHADFVELNNVPCAISQPGWCNLYVTNVSADGEIFRPVHNNTSDIKTVWVECLTKIPKLTGIICDTFPNLQELWIQNCGVEFLEPNTFEGCKNLFGLSLQDNYIIQLNEELFEHNVHLGHLYLSGNQLSYLPNNIFENLSSLQRLNLDHNQFTRLDFENFTGLDNLRYLEIHSNPLVDINEYGILEMMGNLTEIWIGDTNISCERIADLVDAVNGRVKLRLAPFVNQDLVDCLTNEQWQMFSEYSKIRGANLLTSMFLFMSKLNFSAIWIFFELIFGIVFLISYFCFLIRRC